MSELELSQSETPRKKPKSIPYDETAEYLLQADVEGEARHAEKARKAKEEEDKKAAADAALQEQRIAWKIKSKVNVMAKEHERKTAEEHRQFRHNYRCVRANMRSPDGGLP